MLLKAWQTIVKEKWTQNLFLYVAKLRREMERMATTEGYKSKIREPFFSKENN